MPPDFDPYPNQQKLNHPYFHDGVEENENGGERGVLLEEDNVHLVALQGDQPAEVDGQRGGPQGGRAFKLVEKVKVKVKNLLFNR